MKKNYFVLIILFVIIASLKANAFNITVNVDDASRVSLYLGSEEKYWGCFFCFIVFCIFAL